MYKMYNAESDDDRNSLSSSFWSDGEREEEEEEEEEEEVVELERLTGNEDAKPAEETVQHEFNKCNMSDEGSHGGDGDDEEEESRSSTCESPAQSPMTSGYGTYRVDQDQFDQDSRGDLSELRDDEDRSVCSAAACEDAVELVCSQTHLLTVSAHARVEGPGGDGEAETEAEEENFHVSAADGGSTVDEENPDGETVDAEPQEEEVEKEHREESDETSSNKDIKFIDSKVDFSPMVHGEMCEEREGNLRRTTGAASCLEERLEELRLSTSAQHDSDTESDAVTSQSDAQSSGTEELNAFESYIRGMTRTDVGNRLKPKSFIRPTMSQQTMKKTDPVARYFQYKQLWEMFKVPGEQDRRTLRLEIKERLAYQPPPPRPRRVYVPNTYVVPTEKKRSALRWEIRNDLANGLIPYKFTY